MQPWLQLVGTLIYPIPAAVFIANYAAGPSAMSAWMLGGGWMILGFYLLAGVGPFVLRGPLYRKLYERRITIIQAIGLGLGYSLFVLIFHVTSWRAFCRIIRHREDWFKTRRNAEFLSDIELWNQMEPAALTIPVMMGESSEWEN